MTHVQIGRGDEEQLLPRLHRRGNTLNGFHVANGYLTCVAHVVSDEAGEGRWIPPPSLLSPVYLCEEEEDA